MHQVNLSVHAPDGSKLFAIQLEWNPAKDPLLVQRITQAIQGPQAQGPLPTLQDATFPSEQPKPKPKTKAKPKYSNRFAPKATSRQTQESVEEIVLGILQGYSDRYIAQKMRVSKSTVSNIRRGKTYLMWTGFEPLGKRDPENELALRYFNRDEDGLPNDRAKQIMKERLEQYRRDILRSTTKARNTRLEQLRKIRARKMMEQDTPF